MDKVREEFKKFYSKRNQYGRHINKNYGKHGKLHESLLLYNYLKTAKEML